jgi:hypothetical protein
MIGSGCRAGFEKFSEFSKKRPVLRITLQAIAAKFAQRSPATKLLSPLPSTYDAAVEVFSIIHKCNFARSLLFYCRAKATKG